VANDFDFILIDCPPSLGTLSINSMVAANHFIVPMQAENFAFIGLDRIMLISEKVKKRMNPDLDLAGILFVKLDPRTKFSQAVIQSLSENQNFKGKLFNTYIRQDISLMESGAFKQSVYDYAPKSRGADDYNDLAKEILKIYG
jgi:chromosome partitioning protein